MKEKLRSMKDGMGMCNTWLYLRREQRRGTILKGKIPRADKHEYIAPRITVHPM